MFYGSLTNSCCKKILSAFVIIFSSRTLRNPMNVTLFTYRSGPPDSRFRMTHIGDLEQYSIPDKGSGVLWRPQQHRGFSTRRNFVFLILIHWRFFTGTTTIINTDSNLFLFEYRQLSTAPSTYRVRAAVARELKLITALDSRDTCAALHGTGLLWSDSEDVENANVVVLFYLVNDKKNNQCIC